MTHSSLLIQITPESLPSAPSWLGEVTVEALRTLFQADLVA